jgi:hypothetical protein
MDQFAAYLTLGLLLSLPLTVLVRILRLRTKLRSVPCPLTPPLLAAGLRRIYLAKALLWLFLILAICLFAAVASVGVDVDPFAYALVCASGVVVAFAISLCFTLLFGPRGPVIVIGTEGLQDLRISADVIPWDIIVGTRERRWLPVTRLRSIDLFVDHQRLTQMPPSCDLRRKAETDVTPGFPRFSIHLISLDVAPLTMLAAIKAHLETPPPTVAGPWSRALAPESLQEKEVS